ncbi:Permease of the drug/metabolite transporter (DMT) superfamily [Andreprevotia lacus DSM 23236]|jgi:drug/metabolite transporter (DMT)-like permease|uniref:Permease of the drug/metabolite transporter (DMT) superfamily n=1 Tax=Andreprevotia lacus DSM 23236 TaxID=1121001 RepID=A0A1W1XFV3_9NEIS|nr:DMT family transporter [Andreprevotia lacus]SMC22707.1 Permease of the drug/metabolite transporter (DMT) superfamily [Andreprevotia lacus DSM 23236]
MTKRTHTPVWIAEAMLLLVAIVWGTSYGVAKTAIAFYPVLGFLAIRFGLTAILLLPALYKTPALLNRRTALPALGLGLILLAIFLCETYGVAHTTASNAAFLISLCVVFTPLVEWALLRNRPSRPEIIAACVSLFGAWLLTGYAGLARFGVGDLLMLAAAVLRAFMVCSTKRVTAKQPLPALWLTFCQSIMVCLGAGMLALLLLPSQTLHVPVNPVFWWSTLYLVVMCTIFAFFAQNYAVQRSNPTRVALLMGSEPVFGAIFATAWLGEHLSPMAWIGGFLIVAAALWNSLPESKPEGGRARFLPRYRRS